MILIANEVLVNNDTTDSRKRTQFE